MKQVGCVYAWLFLRYFPRRVSGWLDSKAFALFVPVPLIRSGAVFVLPAVCCQAMASTARGLCVLLWCLLRVVRIW